MLEEEGVGEMFKGEGEGNKIHDFNFLSSSNERPGQKW